MKTIFVTGGFGFIGLHFINLLASYHPGFFVINIDKETYAANSDYKFQNEFYQQEKIDIADANAVKKLFQKYDPDYVVNFAAETHVDNSLSNPDIFTQSNIIGVTNLLSNLKPYTRYLQVSTDEVLGPILEGSAREDDRQNPCNPYSASKASAEHFVNAYYHSYSRNVVTTRCTNNFGPFQHREKFIPRALTNLIEDKPIPIFGNGLQRRQWIYVKNHCIGIEKVLLYGKSGEVYHIPGGFELNNLEIAMLLCRLMKKNPSEYIQFIQDRPGHDVRYALNCDKINKVWYPKKPDFQKELEATVKWYTEKVNH